MAMRRDIQSDKSLNGRGLTEYRRIVLTRAIPVAIGFTVFLVLATALLRFLLPTKFHLNVGSGAAPFFVLFVVLIGVSIPIILIATLVYRAETKKLLEAGQFAQSTIDALTAHICVLDTHGKVLATNDQWERFSRGKPTRHTAGLHRRQLPAGV